MEEETQVKTYRIDYKCPKCNDGYLLPSGSMFLTNPPKYPHNCTNNNCDYHTVLDKQYPYIKHKAN